MIIQKDFDGAISRGLSCLDHRLIGSGRSQGPQGEVIGKIRQLQDDSTEFVIRDALASRLYLGGDTLHDLQVMSVVPPPAIHAWPLHTSSD